MIRLRLFLSAPIRHWTETRYIPTIAGENLVNIRFVVTTPGNVTIKVYTLDGTFIEPLVNQVYYQPGIYWTSWDAHNLNKSLVASGVYLITTESPGGHQEFSKVAVIK